MMIYNKLQESPKPEKDKTAVTQEPTKKKKEKLIAKKTSDSKTDLLDRKEISYITISGNMSTSEKNRSIADFKNEED